MRELYRSILLTSSALIAFTNANAQEGGTFELPTIDIQGQGQERGDGPVQGYRATRTTSAVKTDTPLKDVPQVVVVIPKDVLDDRGATTVDDALTMVGGVTKGNNFGGLNNYEFNMRGFPTRNAAKNGIMAVRRYEPDDITNVERVEVLMGPSGALYGRSDPSGFYNVITKRPLDYNFTTLTGSLGSYGQRRATIDGNYVLSEDKKWLGRINAAVESRDSFRDFQHSDRIFLAPVISYTPSADWRFILEGEFLRDVRPFDRGLVAPGGRLGGLPISRFLGEPNDRNLANQYGLVSARIEHDINKDWMVRFATQAKDGALYGWTAEPVSVLADGRTLTRRNTLRNFHWQSWNSQLEAVGKFETGGVKHTLLIGAESEIYRNREGSRRSNVALNPYSIDIFNPVYGQIKPPATALSLFEDSINTYSLYASDQIEWTSKLKTLLSFRVDSYNQNARQVITGQRLSQDSTPVTPKVGVTYDLLPTFTLFASAATSFRPNLDSDTGFTGTSAGKPFPAEKGVGYEAGVKWTFWDNAVSLQAAAFHIVKSNVLTADPANPGFSTTAGEVTSKGFDVNLVGNITPEWKVIGGYAYIDARVTEDINIPVGARFANVPLHSGSFMSVYEWQTGLLAGLGIGAGFTATSNRAGDNSGGTFSVPGYVKFDALAYYKFSEKTRVSLNVYNVFDTVYYAQTRSLTNVYPGQPLTAVLSLKGTF
ncbi:MAG: TonB-dependent siderophore receptor [Beijerinckiaceae bacterium]|nr:TonB-dependent siderophore receptor [Beijerinckiaceae bacterium]